MDRGCAAVTMQRYEPPSADPHRLLPHLRDAMLEADAPMRKGEARLTTDGSCVMSGRSNLGLSPRRGSGGWAAVVEVRGGGEVLKGRVAETTATRMELLAVVRGLRAIPDGFAVLVVTDALVVQQVHEEWRAGRPRRARQEPEDRELWDGLEREFRRLGRARFRYVRKRDDFTPHTRCHKIAGQEARALALELGHAHASAPGEGRRARKASRVGVALEDAARRAAAAAGDDARRRLQVGLARDLVMRSDGSMIDRSGTSPELLW